jgi:adenosylhomocysteine nucleosidase
MNVAETLIAVPQTGELKWLLAAFDTAGYRPRNATIGRLECHVFDDLAMLFTVGGHGKTQHAVQTQHLIEQKATIRAVICAGAAGSLREDLKLGDVVVGLATIEHDYKLRFVQRPLPRHDADAQLADEFRRVLRAATRTSSIRRARQSSRRRPAPRASPGKVPGQPERRISVDYRSWSCA